MKSVLIIVGGEHIHTSLYDRVREECDNLNVITTAEADACYDWIVNEGIKRYLNDTDLKSHVSNHYKHDVYACVFDVLSEEIMETISALVYQNDLSFLSGKVIKTLVTEENIIIARMDS